MRRQVCGDDVDGVDAVVGGDRDAEQALRPQHPQHDLAQRQDRMETGFPSRNAPETRLMVSCLF